MTSHLRIAAIGAAAILLSGCSSMYYSTMESFGREKRDILVSRVLSGQEDQKKAKEQIQTTFERFKTLTNFDGGELEKTYNRLNSEYERCQARAEDLSERIDSIEDVGNALFKEWQAELKQYQRDDLRRASEQKLRETQRRFDELTTAMRGVEDRMKPVVAAFKDQVLFLKHNLNAQAIASLDGTLNSLQSDVTALIKDMDASIAEADQFIQTMQKQS